MKRLLTSLFATGKSSRRPRPVFPKARLRVEALEGRQLLSATSALQPFDVSQLKLVKVDYEIDKVTGTDYDGLPRDFAVESTGTLDTASGSLPISYSEQWDGGHATMDGQVNFDFPAAPAAGQGVTLSVGAQANWSNAGLGWGRPTGIDIGDGDGNDASKDLPGFGNDTGGAQVSWSDSVTPGTPDANGQVVLPTVTVTVNGKENKIVKLTPVYQAPAASQLAASLEFHPDQPGVDLVTTASGPGLVLVSRFETPPVDQGEPSKTVTVKLTGWNSQTTTPVEVLILNPDGSRILLDNAIPNNLPGGLNVFPGEEYTPDVISTADPTNMHNPGVTDHPEYDFFLHFSVLPNSPAGTTPIILRVRQGSTQVDLPMALVVVAAPRTAPAPATPAGVIAATRPAFAWTAVANADRYEVQLEDRSSRNTVIADVIVKTTGWQPASPLTPGHTYLWRVRGINDQAGPGPWSGWQTFTVTSVPPPAPAGVSGTPLSSTQIALSWKPSAGAASYGVWVRVGGKWDRLATLGAGATSYTAQGLTANTTYYFMVGAANAYGTRFGYSAAVTTPKAQQPPAAPGHFMAAALSPSQVILAWAPSAGATGYGVRLLVNGKWTVLANLGVGTTFYVAQGLTAGATYSFDVGASNAGGMSYTGALAVTTPKVSLLPDPFGSPIILDLGSVVAM
jgi:hypothetical protein